MHFNQKYFLALFVSLFFSWSLQAGTAKLSDLPPDVQARLKAGPKENTKPGLHFSPVTNSYVFSAPEQRVTGSDSRPAFTSTLGGEIPGRLEVTDGGTEFSVQLIPMVAGLGPAMRAGETIFYATADGTRLTYTFKRNGVKEDIVLSRPTTDLDLKYFVKLDASLEARLDANGNLLVYGPEAHLSGFIQIADEKSAQLVMKARQAAPKNHLLYVIPSPVVIDGKGKAHKNVAYYSFQSNVLVIHTRNIAALPAPVTIDPSVVVTSSSDFSAGNNEGMIQFQTDAIARSNISAGTIGPWGSASSSLSPGRYAHSSVAYNGFLYVIGGTNGTTHYNEVWAAPIAANGTVGAFVDTTDFAVTGRSEHTSVVYNGYLYVIGGTNGGAALADVRYAPIDASNGSVGDWNTTTSLSPGRWAHTSVVHNGYLYVIGGYDGTNFLDLVEFAPIHGNGTLGSWTTSTGFATGRTSFTSVVYNDYLYVIGGYNGGLLNSVQYAPIHSDHTVGNWINTTNLPTVLWHHTSVALDGYLYVMGGQTSGSVEKDDVLSAPISSNGALGNWTSTANFMTPRQFHTSVSYKDKIYILLGDNGSNLSDVQMAAINSHPTFGAVGPWSNTNGYGQNSLSAAVAYNGYLYVLGGINTGLATSYYAPINSDGTIGSWSTTTPFPSTVGHIEHTAVAYNGYMYIAAGFLTSSYSNEVYYAAINVNGSLGGWVSTSSLPNTSGEGARGRHTSVAYNGHLYMIGGISSNFPVSSKSVLIADINGDGSLGSWSSTTDLPDSRYSHTTVVNNDYIYVLGGANHLNSVLFAPIKSDGTIGTWNYTTAFTTGRDGHTSVAFGGYLYLAGGHDGTVWLNDVQYAQFHSDGTIGAWSPTTSFTPARNGHSSVAYNGYIYIINGYTGSDYLNNIVVAPIQAFTHALGSWAGPSGFSTARFAFGSVASNGYLYVMGGYNNSVPGGYISDVRYAPLNPDGSIGTWVPTVSLPGGRAYFAAVAYNGRIYIAGGNNGVALNDVRYATIQGGGALDSWSAPVLFTTARYGLSMSAYNGYLYISGGLGSAPYHNDVQFATIAANGSLGAFNPTTSFPVARAFHSSVAHNGYLYVLGGFTGLVYTADVRYAPLNSANGQVGAWSVATGFLNARQSLSAFTHNGYMFATGGFTNAGPASDIQLAYIKPDGSLGAWIPAGNFPTARAFHAAPTYNGYVYIIDGTQSSSPSSPPLDNIEYVNLNVPSVKGTYSKLIDLGTTKILDTIRFSASAGPGIHNLTWTYAPDNATAAFGARTTIPDAIPGAAYGVALDACARYFWTRFEFDDTYTNTLDGAGTDLLDFTLTHAPGVPVVNSITDANVCAFSGVQANYTQGGGSTNYSLVQDGSVAVVPYSSGFTFNPRDGVLHSYLVRPVGGVCQIDSNSSNFTDANNSPTATTNLNGSKTTAVHLTWPAAAGATSYNIKRCDSGSGPCTPATIANTAALTWDDSVLGDANRYWYYVESVNGACVSCGNASTIEYLGHFANTGWMANWVSNGTTAGTPGGNQMEAIRILVPSCKLAYEAHVSSSGWLGEVTNGAVAGTIGQGKALQAIKIRLTGAETNLHVCYKAYVQTQGWQAEVCDGTQAGTTGLGLAIQAIEIRLAAY